MSGLLRSALDLLGRDEPGRRRCPPPSNSSLALLQQDEKRALRSALSSTTTSPSLSCSLVDQLEVSTSQAVFETHMHKMARDYEVVSLDAVLSGGNLPRRALLITFDDGYRSCIEAALPILRRLGLPSVFFVTGACLDPDSLPLDNVLSYLCGAVGMDHVGENADPAGRRVTFLQLLDIGATMPYGRRLDVGEELAERFRIDQASLPADRRLFLDPEDLSGLAADGCEVANHSRSHLFCRSIVDEASADSQLVEHARRLESLTGRPVRAFSFPYGRRQDATPMVERVLRESGHEALFLAESRPDLQGILGRLRNRVSLDGPGRAESACAGRACQRAGP